MATFLAIPILSVLIILQSAIVSRLPLLQGTPDLILLVLVAWALQERVRTGLQWSLIGGLFVGFVSIIPLSVPVITYIAITGIALLIRRQIWENSILAMFAVTFLGSVVNQLITLAVINIGETIIPFSDALRLIILPSLLLNLVLAAPVYAVVKDFSEWIYPEELKS